MKTTYKDLFANYAKVERRREKRNFKNSKDFKPVLLAVLKDPNDCKTPASVWFCMHAGCGMEQPSTAMPLDSIWHVYPVDSLNDELKLQAKHQNCAFGSECSYYDDLQ